MRNKEAKLLIVGIATGVALSFSGCTTENTKTTEIDKFDPSKEIIVCEYGVFEPIEETIETEPTKDITDNIEFEPSQEVEVDVYGPAPYME